MTDVERLHQAHRLIHALRRVTLRQQRVIDTATERMPRFMAQVISDERLAEDAIARIADGKRLP